VLLVCEMLLLGVFYGSHHATTITVMQLAVIECVIKCVIKRVMECVHLSVFN
jgi:hypothetical protein